MTDLETLIAKIERVRPDFREAHVNSAMFLAIARELLTARKVVVAARMWCKDPGTLTAVRNLSAATRAHDAAEVARNERDRT